MTNEQRSGHAQYPIRAVSKLTGIGIDTLRAWERRYRAITPTRDNRGRLYSGADVARLRLLQLAVAAGHRVGRIATLPNDELQGLAAAPPPASSPSPHVRADFDASRLHAALLRFDSVAIDQEFSRMAAALPPEDLVRDVLLPAVREVGKRWNHRRGGIAHEHLISSTMQHLLGSFLRVYARRDLPTRLLFATPSGDRHELGILAGAMLAANRGLAVSYLGPDLPASEIIAAAKLANAHVLVLGITLRDGAAPREQSLRAIVRGLPPRVELWVCGPAATRWVRALGFRGLTLTDFDAYIEQLDRVAQRNTQR